MSHFDRYLYLSHVYPVLTSLSFIASSAPIVDPLGRTSDGRLPNSQDPDEMPHCGIRDLRNGKRNNVHGTWSG